MKHIGIDIGGTSIKGIVACAHEAVARAVIPTDTSSGLEGIKQSVFRCINELLVYARDESGIGVGSAGDIDPFTGRVIFATDTLPGFTGFEMKAVLEKEFGRRVCVVNDAAAAFIGELRYGAAKNQLNAVMLTLGTGLGAAIAVNGKLLLGENLRSARIGHIPLHKNGRSCTCSMSDCAEQYVSATGLKKNAAQAGCESGDCEEILVGAAHGDKRCKLAVDMFTDDLCAVIRTVRCIFDPGCIVLGGGLVELKRYWWEGMLARLPEDSAALMCPALLGNMAGSIGAASLLEDDSLLK